MGQGVVLCTQQCGKTLIRSEHAAESHTQRESLGFAWFFQDLKWKQHEFFKPWPSQEAATGNSGKQHVKAYELEARVALDFTLS